MSGMRIFFAGMPLLAMANMASAQETGPSAAQNWEAVAHCAQLDGAQARHGCIDQLLRDTGLLDPERELAEARQDFGTDPANLAADANAAPVAQGVQIDQLETQVAHSGKTSDRKLLIITSEGAAWKQTDSKEMRRLPDKGQSFSVEVAALGSYRCKIGKFTTFRCERLN